MLKLWIAIAVKDGRVADFVFGTDEVRVRDIWGRGVESMTDEESRTDSVVYELDIPSSAARDGSMGNILFSRIAGLGGALDIPYMVELAADEAVHCVINNAEEVDEHGVWVHRDRADVLHGEIANRIVEVLAIERSRADDADVAKVPDLDCEHGAAYIVGRNDDGTLWYAMAASSGGHVPGETAEIGASARRTAAAPGPAQEVAQEVRRFARDLSNRLLLQAATVEAHAGDVSEEELERALAALRNLRALMQAGVGGQELMTAVLDLVTAGGPFDV